MASNRRGAQGRAAGAEAEDLLEVVPGEPDRRIGDPAGEASPGAAVAQAVAPEVGEDGRARSLRRRPAASRAAAPRPARRRRPRRPRGRPRPRPPRPRRHRRPPRPAGMAFGHRRAGGLQLLDQGEELQLGEELAQGVGSGGSWCRASGSNGTSAGRYGWSTAPWTDEPGPGAAAAPRGRPCGRSRRRAPAASSSEPYSWMRRLAPFSPMPGTPGMLSIESPIRARTSTTFSGGTPKSSSTSARAVELVAARVVEGDAGARRAASGPCRRRPGRRRTRLGRAAGERAQDVVGLVAGSSRTGMR